jgi:hypothetical protein
MALGDDRDEAYRIMEQSPEEFIPAYLAWLKKELEKTITEKDWEYKLIEKAESVRLIKTQHVRKAV